MTRDTRAHETTASPRAERLVRAAARPARAACFWLAVALPLLHVPLFLAGLSTPGEVGAFLVLLVANAVAILLGRGYAPAGRPPRPDHDPDSAPPRRPGDDPHPAD